jgi:excisionase family DNA binding protein
VEAGLLRGAQKTKGASWRVQLAEEDRKRLMTAAAPSDWLTLKAAASRLGVSQQTVLQRLKDRKLEGVRVRTGRKVHWRIRLTAKSYDTQPSLFS